MLLNKIKHHRHKCKKPLRMICNGFHTCESVDALISFYSSHIYLRMSIFDAYNTEFQSILEDIKKNISDLKSYLKTTNNKSDAKSSNITKLIEALFSQSNELIKQMELEVRSHDIITRKKLNEKLLAYKTSIGNNNIIV